MQTFNWQPYFKRKVELLPLSYNRVILASPFFMGYII